MTRWEVPEHRLQSRGSSFSQGPLSTSANKNKWYGEDERCNLRNERNTLNHIPVGCKTALSQGRYTWSHNNVLQDLFEKVKKKVKFVMTIHKNAKSIAFVKEREKTAQEPCINSSYMNSNNNWEVKVDLYLFIYFWTHILQLFAMIKYLCVLGRSLMVG